MAEFRMRKRPEGVSAKPKVCALLESDSVSERVNSDWDDPDVVPDTRTDIPTGRRVDEWEDTHEHDRAESKRKRKPRVNGGSADRFSMRKRA